MKKIIAFITSIAAVFMFTNIVMAEPMLKEAEINPAYIEYWKLSKEERSKLLEPPMTLPKAQPKSSTFSILRSGTSLPTSYNATDKKYITSVKDQGNRGVCWTFSAMAMLESYMLKSGQGTFDLSERHMDYATSHYSENENAFADGKYNNEGFLKSAGEGGNILYSMPYLFREQGVVLESAMPYTDTTPVKVADLRNAASANIWVKDYAVYPSYYAGNDDTYRISYINQVKSHIYNYGAMDVTMNTNVKTSSHLTYLDAYYNADNTAEEVDHAVTVVGWDDTYSKDNFQPDKPGSDGAWIIKNSWGTGAHGGDGYFYMSYEDKSFYQVNAGVLSAKANKDYENMYSYDTFGHNAALYTNGNNRIFAANVFEAKESGEILKSITVGFDSAATVNIYVNPDGGMENVSSMKKVASGSFNYDGYKTFDLSAPITLNGGPFAVVVEYIYSGSTATIPIEGQYTGAYQNVVANKGESYWSNAGGQWIDLTYFSNPANCSIKAFTYEPDADTVVYPGNLKATALSNSEIRLTWNKVSGATKYEIFESTTNSNAYDTYKSLGTTTDTSFVSSGLPSFKTHYYVVKAYKNDSSGTEISSDYSNMVYTTTLKDPTLTGLSVSGEPHINKSVTLTAYSSGYTGNVQYRFTWTRGTAQGVIADYGSDSTANFKIPAVGAYTLKVEMKTPDGNIQSKTANITAVDPYAVTITGLSVPAKANSGQTVTVKATVSGATTGLQYQFVWKRGTSTGTIRNYGATNSASFKIPAAGTYGITVNVKAADGRVVSKTASLVAGDPNNYSISKINAPVLSWVGNTVKISPTISGNTYGLKYKFVWSYNNWSKWGVISDFSTTNSASFKLQYQGKYDFYVDVKATNGKIITKYASCTVMGPNYFAVSKVNVPTSGKIGQTVNISSTVTGNTSGLKYKFVWSYNNWSKWGVIRDFSTTNSAAHKLQYAGKYDFYVDVKGKDGKIITKIGSMTVTDPYAYTFNSISAPKSGTVGNWANVKATTSGYTSGIKYKFVWSYNNWSKWGVAKDFSTSNSASIQLKYPGTYDFYVDVKGVNGKITTKYVRANVGLGWSPKSISATSSTVKLGNTVRFTGSVSGGSGLTYKFVWMKNNWKNWGVIRDFNNSNTTTFKPTSRGSYTIYMDVKDKFGNIRTITRNINVV